MASSIMIEDWANDMSVIKIGRRALRERQPLGVHFGLKIHTIYNIRDVTATLHDGRNSHFIMSPSREVTMEVRRKMELKGP
jgi:hypothetical protein